MAEDPKTNPRAAGLSGRRHQLAQAAALTEAVKVNVAALLAGLGREPTAAEQMDAEALCGLLLRARRLRDSGRDDTAVLREYANLRRDTVFGRQTSPKAD